jgi:MFS family permease
MSARTTTIWTFVITSIALFMVTLDNLVVTMALPSIRLDLGASIEDLEWTVNAYTLSFAVLLLTGAALGDRFGRRRLFAIGLGIFTLASAAAALAPNVETLIAARAVQGLGGAIVTPLTLTILSAAVPPEKRGLALGAWGGVGGLGVALGPVIGGAVVEGLSWQWIFWLNVPIGLMLLPLAWNRLKESFGPDSRLDLAGLALASVGLFGIVLGLVRGNSVGWGSFEILGSLALGTAFVAAFVLWELRTPAPMLPMRFFRNRTFAATNVASLFMFFGMFGSIFLLAQFLQTVQGYSPLEAGIRTLPWTAMPIFIAPLAGPLRPDRRAAADGDRARAAVDRPGVARVDHGSERRVWTARARVRDLGDRDGALLRPRGERRPLQRAQVGGGEGIGRQQRHPRAWRRLRSRRARVDLLPLRRLRVARGLRRRPHAGDLGRRGSRRCGRDRGALRSREEAGGGVRSRRARARARTGGVGHQGAAALCSAGAAA